VTEPHKIARIAFKLLAGCALLPVPDLPAQDHAAHAGAEHAMSVDMAGMSMNHNDTVLPDDCAEIKRDYAFEIHAGTRFAENRPGLTFGYDTSELAVEPCSRVTIHFFNHDEVRHQWMLHGLPRYLYPGGMFHLEAAGGESRSASFIVPSDDKTYLVHCDISQHMEKGMKAQLKVGAGSGDLWSVPDVSAPFRRASYLPAGSPARLSLLSLLSLVFMTVIAWRLRGRR